MKKTCITIILCLVIVFLIIFMGQIQIDGERRMYNNGICHCGGHYKFISASTHRGAGSHSTVYVYVCDSCQDILELSNYFKKNT